MALFVLVNESSHDHGKVVKIVKLSTDQFICPWGSKIHIGVEDVVLNVKNNTNSMNNTLESTKHFPGGDFSDEIIMDNFLLDFFTPIFRIEKNVKFKVIVC